jgi:hypothetical protein
VPDNRRKTNYRQVLKRKAVIMTYTNNTINTLRTDLNKEYALNVQNKNLKNIGNSMGYY